MSGEAPKGPGEGQAAGWTPEMENESLSGYLLLICEVLAGALIVWRFWSALVKHIRTVTSLTNDTQRYYVQASKQFSFIKKNILYAPMFRKRHNREFQLSSAINVGTLPTRFQFMFLLAYFTTNVVFCVINIPFADSFDDALKQLRNRSGSLAVVNMLPLFIMAGRNNPFIGFLHMSFDTFNLLHRWFGRIVALEAVTHTLAFLIAAAAKGGWEAALNTALSKPFMMFGFIATCAFVAILFQAASIARHAFYETFLLLHIALAAVAVAGLYYHLSLGQIAAIKWMMPLIATWVVDRLIRVVLVGKINFGKGGTKTLIEALPGNAVRITVTMARPWAFSPGQHAYLYLPSISLWESHPFSVAWSEEAEDLKSDKLAMNRQDVLAMRKTSMSFIVRGRSGMTHKLYQKAASRPDGRLTTTCWVEGPYGGVHMMHSFGTVMLFAGGVGITHAVPHVRDLVTGYANNTIATRKVVLVWIIQSPEHLEWIRPWMTEILAMEKRREVLRIMLFVSRPRSTKEIHSPSSTVQMFPGRPNIDTLISMEAEQQVGAMGVTVCGPGALSDEVRQAVRNKQYGTSIDFIEEAFSW